MWFNIMELSAKHLLNNVDCLRIYYIVMLRVSLQHCVLLCNVAVHVESQMLRAKCCLVETRLKNGEVSSE
jgi:hypothetical protein